MKKIEIERDRMKETKKKDRDRDRERFRKNKTKMDRCEENLKETDLGIVRFLSYKKIMLFLISNVRFVLSC